MPNFRGIVVAAAVLVIFVAGGFTAYQVADSGQDGAPDVPKTATNESIVVEYDTYQYVDNATAQYTTGFNNSSVTVYNNQSMELDRGTDYFWNNSDGTILFNNTSATTEGNASTITYGYFKNTEAVQEASGPLTVVTQAIGWVGVLAAGLSLVVVLLAFAAIAGKRLAGNSMPRSNR